MQNKTFLTGLLLAALIWCGSGWSSDSVDLSSRSISHLVFDAARNKIYATSPSANVVFFIDATTMTIDATLSVNAPYDLSINATGSTLFVISDSGTVAAPKACNMVSISLTTHTVTSSFALHDLIASNLYARHVTCGRAGRAYVSSGSYQDQEHSRAVNTDTGADLGEFAAIGTNLVITPDKTRLFGQRVYDGNLGEMGAYNISTDSISLANTCRYPPYPYGWSDENPYVISADGSRLMYDNIMFSTIDLKQMAGIFPQNILALSPNGNVAVSTDKYYSSTTLATTGNPTLLGSLPFASTLMVVGSDGSLYAYNATSFKIFKIALYSAAQVAPVAVAESYTCNGAVLNVPADTGVLANDSDANQDSITAEVGAQPASGTVSLASDGSFIYTPPIGFTGATSFTYRAKDSAGNYSDVTTVNIQVNAPVVSAAADLGGTVITHFVVDEVRKKIYATATATHRLLFIDATTMRLEKSMFIGKSPRDLDIDATGNFLFVASEGQAPTVPGSATIAKIALQTQTVTARFAAAIMFWNPQLNTPKHVAAGHDGRVFYNTGFVGNGNDDLEARVIDTVAGTDAGTGLGIATNMVVNSARTVMYSQSVNRRLRSDITGTSISNLQTGGTNVGAGSDPWVISKDGSKLIFDKSLLSLTNIDTSLGTFPESIYALTADGRLAAGATTLYDTSTFATLGSAKVLVTLPFSSTLRRIDSSGYLYSFKAADAKIYKSLVYSPVPAAPVAADDSYTFLNRTFTATAALGVLNNDVDGNYDTMTASVVQTTSSGTLTLQGDGSFVYTPSTNFFGVDTFTYKVTDSTGLISNIATVTLNALHGGYISYTASGSHYLQNFNTLPSSGTFTIPAGAFADMAIAPLNLLALNGWQFANTSSTNQRFLVDDGSATTNVGSVYSLGSSASPDRSLGLAASTNGTSSVPVDIPRMGAIFVNETGAPLKSVTISYRMEQWRSGTSTTNTIPFEYSIGANDISTVGTGTAFTPTTALDMVSLKSNTSTTLDGNAAGNFANKTATFNVNWPAGAQLVIRWTDANETGEDDKLAVDDFDFSASVFPVVQAVTGMTPAPSSVQTTVSPVLLTFRYNLSTTSVNANTVKITSGGPDGVLDTADDISITTAAISILSANQIRIDLPGQLERSQQYRVRLIASAAAGVNSVTAIQGSGSENLDGEFSGTFPSGDNSAGGDFIAQFQMDLLSTTVAASSTAGTYGGSAVQLSASVSATDAINSGTILFQLKNGSANVGSAVTSGTVVNGTASVTYAIPSGTSVNSYTIVATYTGGGSFAGSVDDSKQITIAPAALTINPANAGRSYGAGNPIFSGSISGIQYNDTITAIYSTTATAASAVGPYSIIATLSDPGNKLGNYTIALNTGTLTITATPLTTAATNATRVYGSANPKFTGSLTGVKNNDNITYNFVSTASMTSAVGTYLIVPALVDPDNKIGNYSVVSTNAVLTVTKASLTATASSTNRLYGTANPAFSGVLDGVLNGDNILANYTSAATAATRVGHYPIVPALIDPDGRQGNYAVLLINGILTINRAALSVTATDASRPYGSENPQFTGAIAGIQNSDPISATYSTVAAPASDVGTYPIVAAFVDPSNLLGNYTTTFNNGTLSVEKAVPPISWNTPTRIIAGNALTATQLNATAQSLVDGTDLNGEFVYTPSAGTILAPGLGQALSVVFNPVDTKNYDSASGSATIDVDPAIVPAITSILTATLFKGEAFTYTITADGSTPMTFSATDFPAGLAFSGDTLSGNPTATGVFNIVLTASNYGGSDSRILKMIVLKEGANSAPVISSSPTASVNPALTGFPIRLSVQGDDADGDALDYTWDFGDGTFGSGAAVTKQYAAEGMYVAKVVVFDGVASVTQSLNVVILGVPENRVFQVQKIKVAFNLVQDNRDSMSVTGLVPVPKGIQPAVRQVRIVIGGVDRSYILDKKWISKNFEFALKKPVNGYSQFIFNLKNQSLFAKLADFGFTKTTNNSSIDLPIILILDGQTHMDRPSVKYSARSNKKGPVSGSAIK